GQIVELAQQRHLEVIAEAWDLWGFEVGNFPDGWAEWNGRYRDAMRDFLRGMGSAQAFMAMMNGDFDHFADQGGPQQSVNFLTAHDGFTLADLMSYNEKSNGHPYPFGPSDGGNDSNSSWDSGGDAALRRQRIRNAIAVLMLSRGVPMIVAGDEYGRTQNGNNNPWAIDSVGVWNNWAQVVSHAPHQAAVDPDQADADAHGAHYHDNLGVAPTGQDVNPVFRFAVAMMRLRHEHPALRQRHYGDDSRGGDDVSYLFRSVDGHGDPEPHARALEVFIDAAGAASPDSERANDLLVLINMWHDDVEFALPAPHTGKWRRIADTAARSEEYCNAWAAAQAQILTDSHTVPAWSVTVLRGGGGV
ncbi:MAG: glycogen debranching enzyme, partial [Micrococcales bacterium]